VGNRKVFFFVQGGVDSTVALHLPRARGVRSRCARPLCGYRIRRDGETDFVRRMGNISVGACRGAVPGGAGRGDGTGAKSHIIGEEFVSGQERILDARHVAGKKIGSWVRGRSTRTPSNRRPGKASLIKTHTIEWPHSTMMEGGRIVERWKSFIRMGPRGGRELGLSAAKRRIASIPRPRSRHPHLCSDSVSVRTHQRWRDRAGPHVGVQGDEPDSRPTSGLILIEGFQRSHQCATLHTIVNCRPLDCDDLDQASLGTCRRIDGSGLDRPLNQDPIFSATWRASMMRPQRTNPRR